MRRTGVLSRHRHPMLVVGYVIKGRWKYLEYDWTAEAGSFVYEPPGAMIYVDERGRKTDYEDVFTKIDMCRAHDVRTDLGDGYVDQFIR